MKSYIVRRFYNIINDSVLKFGCCISIVMMLCQAWMFFDSNYMYQPMIRVIGYFLATVAGFFFGREGLFKIAVLMAYCIVPEIMFINYTPFLMILCYMMIKTKSEKIRDNLKVWIPLLIPYFILICVACELHDKSASHLVYHLLGCFTFFSIDWFFVRNKRNIKPLILDKDQERILRDLASGKIQKELDYFSKNTITDKLKDAIQKNNLMTKEQLIMKFMLTHTEYM